MKVALRPVCRTCHRPTLPGLQACLDSSNPDGSTTLCTPAHCAIAGCDGEAYASRLCERDFHLWREFSPARKEALAGDREALLAEFLAWREKRHAESPQEVNLRETLEEVLGLVEAQEEEYGDLVHGQGGPCALCLVPDMIREALARYDAEIASRTPYRQTPGEVERKEGAK